MAEGGSTGVGAPSGVTIHEASLSVLRSVIGRDCDALLIRAGRGDVLAAAVVERHVPCMLHAEGGHLSAILALRGRSLIAASTFLHAKDVLISETIAASACGRRLDELVDVGNGGHQIIEGIRRDGEDLIIDCREDVVDIPEPGTWARRRAASRTALAVMMGYFPDGPFDCWHDNDGRRRYYVMAQVALMGLILHGASRWADGRQDLLTSPGTQIACALIGIVVAMIWPPRGWRRSVVPTISRLHSVERERLGKRIDLARARLRST